jgi:hypothetical protein
VDLRNSEQLLGVVFSTFCGQKQTKTFKKNILASALKSYIKRLLYFFFVKKFKKNEKIGYHSNFNFQCNTERGFKESLSIALHWATI